MSGLPELFSVSSMEFLVSLGEPLLKKGLPQTPTRKLLTIWVKAWMIMTT